MRTYSSAGVDKYITGGFLSVILAGTLLLLGSFAAYDVVIPPLDALFLSASAVCVTGFSPVEDIAALPIPSQIILLLLVQVGGIGIMGGASILALVTRQRLGLRQRLFIATELGVDSPMNVLGVLKLVFAYTVSFEAAGACLLYMKFASMGLSPGMALYHAVFHAVSAFCSGGFSLYPDSLDRFSGTFILPATVMALMVVGGLGFPVLNELRDRRLGRLKFLSPYARIVLTSTAALTLTGAVLYTIFEWNAAFAGMSPLVKVWNGLFTSLSARGGGFHTVDYPTWSAEGLMTTIFFMFIGGAPFSTAGGLKITTFAVLLLAAVSEIRQEEDVVAFGRKIPYSTVRRALAIAFIYILTLFVATVAMSKLETLPFYSLVFDAISALGTSGLSSGITPKLSGPGKIVVVLLMFWGRVGILTFSYSLIRRERMENVRFPETNIPLG
ncbi:MAG: TrkH family potassium uptake protein [Synergistaceae bacterium]|jgi:trk system potassium uptake protein TrkH|nr:TrkH family potassium uptake protein [Synergistaceae bacterium]